MPTVNFPTPVALVEDHAVLRRDMAAQVQATVSFACVAAWGSAEEAIEALPSVRPALLLVDLQLPGRNGVSLLRQLQRERSPTICLVVTQHDDDTRLFGALEAGALGYLHKPVEAADLVAALEVARGGGSPMSPAIARRVLQRFLPGPLREKVDTLTVQERELLDALASGMKIEAVAAERNCSVSTVNNHLRHVYQKLQANGMVQAIAHYVAGAGPGVLPTVQKLTP